MINRLALSKGNSKIGRIMNLSLTPVASCGSVPCAKKCYAIKSYRQYPVVKAAWDSNFAYATTDLNGFFNEILANIERKKPSLFRWHVGGDIPNQAYLDKMIELAENTRYTKYLAFTKQHELNYTKLPENLTIIASFWPKWGSPDRVDLPKAWMVDDDNVENRWSNNNFMCSHKCDECAACWFINYTGKDVLFPEH